MIFLKRRAMMTRASFNYKTVSGIGSIALENCVETKFKRLVLSGNSTQTSTTGAQLFDIENIDDTTCVTTIPNQAFAYDQLYVLSNMIPVKQGEKIVKGNTRSTMCIFLNLEKQPILSTKTKLNDNTSIEVPEGAHYFCFNVLKTNLNKEVMCNIGTSILPYEPYTGGKPSPSPEYPQEIVSAGKYDEVSGKYVIDVQVIGKNLIDIDALKNENGYMSGAYEKSRDIDHFNIVKGKRYLLITKGKPLVAGDYSSVYFGDETLKYRVNHYDVLGTAVGYTSFTSDLKQNRAILTAKKTATITKMILHGKANTRKDDYDVEEFGLFEILEDNTNIDYEPYKEPQTTQIALDEPLRGIGGYKDVVTKDGIVRKIKEIVLDENTGFINHLGGIQNKTICFAAHILEDATKIPALNNAMSDKIEKVTYVDGQDKECFTLFNKRIYIKLSRERNIDTVEKLKEWLKQNPIKIQYLLQEPVLETFENRLDSLHTNDGTTIITVDSGEVETGIEVEYAVKE